jgi:hypothetical protein
MPIILTTWEAVHENHGLISAWAKSSGDLISTEKQQQQNLSMVSYVCHTGYRRKY